MDWEFFPMSDKVPLVTDPRTGRQVWKVDHYVFAWHEGMIYVGHTDPGYALGPCESVGAAVLFSLGYVAGRIAPLFRDEILPVRD
jgi:hypothetical protein